MYNGQLLTKYSWMGMDTIVGCIQGLGQIWCMSDLISKAEMISYQQIILVVYLEGYQLVL